MAVPAMHSELEAVVFMQINPCECGDATPPPFGELSGWREQTVVEYRGACPRCGRPRLFRFGVPEDLHAVPDNSFSRTDAASELIDAGQWRSLVDHFHRWPADLDGLAADERGSAWSDSERAASAMDELLKFLPPGAGEVPESAFWTAQGRRRRESEPWGFRREVLEEARELCRQLADPGGRATFAAETAGGEPEPPLPARTHAEADLFIEIRPCPCGRGVPDPDAFSLSVAPGTPNTVTYHVGCAICGRPREFTFALPERAPDVPGFGAAYGLPGDPPSRLLDAGEFWAAAQEYAAAATDLDLPGADWGDYDQWAAMAETLEASALCVDEALRFLPDGAEAIPAELIRSGLGRQVYQSSTVEFEAARLRELRAARWAALADFHATHPRPEAPWDNESDDDD